jgi:hypothetical protein
MADKKVSELGAITNLTSDDLLMVVNDPSGSPASKKITVGNLFGNVAVSTTHKGLTTFRANTTISGTTLTVSANSTFNGTVTYNNGITFNQGATFSNTNVNVFGGSLIVNGTTTANGNINVTGSVLSDGTNIIGTNGKLHANNSINSGTITEAMMQTKPIANTVARSLIAGKMSVANTQALHTNITANLNSSITNTLAVIANTNTTVNDRIQVANAVNRISNDTQIMSANLIIDGITTGNTATSGIHISNGAISLFSATGAPSYIDLYCEVNNAHRVRLQAPVHAAYSGNLLVTLPTRSGNSALTSGETFTGTTKTANLDVNGTFRVTTKVADFSTSNAVTESVTAGSIYYSNTYLYVVTDSNTIKRVQLSTF